MAADYTYEPILAIDAVTLAPVGGVTGTVTDADTGAPVTTYNMGGVAAPLVTNARGYIPQFKASAPRIAVAFGSLTMEKEAIENDTRIIDEAVAANTAALTGTFATQTQLSEVATGDPITVSDVTMAAAFDDTAGEFRGRADTTYVPSRVAQADRTATDDATTIIQGLINTARDAVRANYGAPNVVTIPAGRYRITSTITVPPYVKVQTAGAVILEWYGTGTCLHFTPLADDPDPLYTPLIKQQWAKGDLLSGRVGGLTILNRNTRTEGVTNNIGVEFGSRTALAGTNRHLSRYEVASFAVREFDKAIRLNTFNHYIATYRDLHIEHNTTGVEVGTTGVNTVNAGENFMFDHCLFSAAKDAVRNLTDAFDFNFMSCSFDYNTRSVIRDERGYGRYYFSGGHIEATNNERTSTEAGIVVCTATGADPRAYVRFDGTTMLHKTQPLLRGANLVATGAFYSRVNPGDTDPVFPNPILAEEGVTAHNLTNLLVRERRMTTLRGNRLTDPHFVRETVGAVTTLTDWAIVKDAPTTAEIVTDTPVSGGKALKITLPPAGYYKLTHKHSIPAFDRDERWGLAVFKADVPGSAQSFAMELYGADGVLISTTAPVAATGVPALPAGQWNVPNFLNTIPAASVPDYFRAATVRPVFTFSNPTAGTVVVTVPLVYFGR